MNYMKMKHLYFIPFFVADSNVALTWSSRSFCPCCGPRPGGPTPSYRPRLTSSLQVRRDGRTHRVSNIVSSIKWSYINSNKDHGSLCIMYDVVGEEVSYWNGKRAQKKEREREREREREKAVTWFLVLKAKLQMWHLNICSLWFLDMCDSRSES